jgi:hypothetical protein
LKDCGFRPIQTKHHPGWLIKATDAGLAYQNLYIIIGFSDQRKTSKAYVSTSNLRGEQVIVLVILMDRDPSDDVDIVYRFNWGTLVHEFIHVMDYRRGYLRHKARQEQRGRPNPLDNVDQKYYNTAIEFNAFYQQGLHAILTQLSREDWLESVAKRSAMQQASFTTFQTEFLKYFDSHWLRILNPEMKRRFVKRFYQFYMLVKTQWPDMDAVQEIASEREATFQKWQNQNEVGTG